jgi:hypothetical protein
VLPCWAAAINGASIKSKNKNNVWRRITLLLPRASKTGHVQALERQRISGCNAPVFGSG